MASVWESSQCLGRVIGTKGVGEGGAGGAVAPPHL